MIGDAELIAGLRERGLAVAHTVRLVECGPRKIMVIKVVRELTGWGLRAAKDAVDSSHTTILAAVDLDQAQRAAAELREAGASVEIDLAELHLYAFEPGDPRRGDQPIERIRVLSWGLAFEHGRLGDWQPGAITELTPAALLAAIDERREAWAAAGKFEAADELAILERLSAREPALESRLRLAEEDQVRAREAAVYGDWLQTQGDPRGLIAAAAFALAETRDGPQAIEREQQLDGLVEAHAAHLFGPAFESVGHARWTWLGPVLDSLQLHGNPSPLTAKQLTELFHLPVCACLRSLAIVGPLNHDLALDQLLLTAPFAPGLRALRISGAANMTLRGDVFARLETLALIGQLQLGPAKLPALRKLDLHIQTPFAPLAANFVALDMPTLEHFALTVTSHDYWDQNYGPLQDNLAELLAQPGFAKLRSLELGGGPLLIGFAKLLAGIPAIATLEHIDLRGAQMTAECRAELERSSLPGLLLL